MVLHTINIHLFSIGFKNPLLSRLSFPAREPPDPRRVSEGVSEGVSERFSKGFRRVL